METFIAWLETQMSIRGWKPADLAHHAGIGNATLSRILNGTRKAGTDVCLGIAKALNYPPELVFRHAGLLPPLPAKTDQDKQLLHLFHQLHPNTRNTILTATRSIVRQQHSQAPPPQPGSRTPPLHDQSISYQAGPEPSLQDLITHLFTLLATFATPEQLKHFAQSLDTYRSTNNTPE